MTDCNALLRIRKSVVKSYLAAWYNGTYVTFSERNYQVWTKCSNVSKLVPSTRYSV